MAGPVVIKSKEALKEEMMRNGMNLFEAVNLMDQQSQNFVASCNSPPFVGVPGVYVPEQLKAFLDEDIDMWSIEMYPYAVFEQVMRKRLAGDARDWFKAEVIPKLADPSFKLDTFVDMMRAAFGPTSEQLQAEYAGMLFFPDHSDVKSWGKKLQGLMKDMGKTMEGKEVVQEVCLKVQDSGLRSDLLMKKHANVKDVCKSLEELITVRKLAQSGLGLGATGASSSRPVGDSVTVMHGGGIRKEVRFAEGESSPFSPTVPGSSTASRGRPEQGEVFRPSYKQQGYGSRPPLGQHEPRHVQQQKQWIESRAQTSPAPPPRAAEPPKAGPSGGRQTAVDIEQLMEDMKRMKIQMAQLGASDRGADGSMKVGMVGRVEPTEDGQQPSLEEMEKAMRVLARQMEALMRRRGVPMGAEGRGLSEQEQVAVSRSGDGAAVAVGGAMQVAGSSRVDSPFRVSSPASSAPDPTARHAKPAPKPIGHASSGRQAYPVVEKGGDEADVRGGVETRQARAVGGSSGAGHPFVVPPLASAPSQAVSTARQEQECERPPYKPALAVMPVPTRQFFENLQPYTDEQMDEQEAGPREQNLPPRKASGLRRRRTETDVSAGAGAVAAAAAPPPEPKPVLDLARVAARTVVQGPGYVKLSTRQLYLIGGPKIKQAIQEEFQGMHGQSQGYDASPLPPYAESSLRSLLLVRDKERQSEGEQREGRAESGSRVVEVGGASSPSPRLNSVVPDASRALIMVRGTIEGHPVVFTVDTGAQASVLQKPIAVMCGLQKSAKRGWTFKGVGAPMQRSEGTADAVVNVGGLKARLPMLIIDDPDQGFHALLGIEWVRACVRGVDIKHNLLLMDMGGGVIKEWPMMPVSEGSRLSALSLAEAGMPSKTVPVWDEMPGEYKLLYIANKLNTAVVDFDAGRVTQEQLEGALAESEREAKAVMEAADSRDEYDWKSHQVALLDVDAAQAAARKRLFKFGGPKPAAVRVSVRELTNPYAERAGEEWGLGVNVVRVNPLFEQDEAGTFVNPLFEEDEATIGWAGMVSSEPMVPETVPFEGVADVASSSGDGQPAGCAADMGVGGDESASGGSAANGPEYWCSTTLTSQIEDKHEGMKGLYRELQYLRKISEVGREMFDKVVFSRSAEPLVLDNSHMVRVLTKRVQNQAVLEYMQMRMILDQTAPADQVEDPLPGSSEVLAAIRAKPIAIRRRMVPTARLGTTLSDGRLVTEEMLRDLEIRAELTYVGSLLVYLSDDPSELSQWMLSQKLEAMLDEDLRAVGGDDAPHKGFARILDRKQAREEVERFRQYYQKKLAGMSQQLYVRELEWVQLALRTYELFKQYIVYEADGSLHQPSPYMCSSFVAGLTWPDVWACESRVMEYMVVLQQVPNGGYWPLEDHDKVFRAAKTLMRLCDAAGEPESPWGGEMEDSCGSEVSDEATSVATSVVQSTESIDGSGAGGAVNLPPEPQVWEQHDLHPSLSMEGITLPDDLSDVWGEVWAEGEHGVSGMGEEAGVAEPELCVSLQPLVLVGAQDDVLVHSPTVEVVTSEHGVFGEPWFGAGVRDLGDEWASGGSGSWDESESDTESVSLDPLDHMAYDYSDTGSTDGGLEGVAAEAPPPMHEALGSASSEQSSMSSGDDVSEQDAVDWLRGVEAAVFGQGSPLPAKPMTALEQKWWEDLGWDEQGPDVMNVMSDNQGDVGAYYQDWLGAIDAFTTDEARTEMEAMSRWIMEDEPTHGVVSPSSGYLRILSTQAGPGLEDSGGRGEDYEFRLVDVPGFPMGVKVRKSLSEATTKMLVWELSKRPNAFAFSLDDLREPCRFKPHTIQLTDYTPFRQKPWRRPQAYEDTCAKLAWKLVDAGICELSTSSYSSEMLLIPKGKHSDLGIEKSKLSLEDTHRAAQDYRRLNALTVSWAYPMPTTQQRLEQIGIGRLFSKVDVKGAFYQVDLQESDRALTAFRIKDALLQFRRMPMGLKNSPATWVQGMDETLRGLPSSTSYFDDCLSYTLGSSKEEMEREHLRDVLAMLDAMIAKNVRCNPIKCIFYATRVVFTGFIVEGGFIRADPAKTRAVLFFRPERSLKDTQSFLGFVRFYAPGIEGLAPMAKPLFARLKKNNDGVWTVEMQHATVRLKIAVIMWVGLWVPRPEKPLILACDFSAIALGACLSQLDDEGIERPIAFASRVCTSAEEKLGATMGEVAALVYAVTYFHQYLWGKPFTIVTDHQALVFLTTTKDLRSKLARFAVLLSELDYTVVYKPGKFHGNVDALSRTVPLVPCLPDRPQELDPLAFGQDEGVSPSVPLMQAVLTGAGGNTCLGDVYGSGAILDHTVGPTDDSYVQSESVGEGDLSFTDVGSSGDENEDEGDWGLRMGGLELNLFSIRSGCLRLTSHAWGRRGFTALRSPAPASVITAAVDEPARTAEAVEAIDPTPEPTPPSSTTELDAELQWVSEVLAQGRERAWQVRWFGGTEASDLYGDCLDVLRLYKSALHESGGPTPTTSLGGIARGAYTWLRPLEVAQCRAKARRAAEEMVCLMAECGIATEGLPAAPGITTQSTPLRINMLAVPPQPSAEPPATQVADTRAEGAEDSVPGQVDVEVEKAWVEKTRAWITTQAWVAGLCKEVHEVETFRECMQTVRAYDGALRYRPHKTGACRERAILAAQRISEIMSHTSDLPLPTNKEEEKELVESGQSRFHVWQWEEVMDYPLPSSRLAKVSRIDYADSLVRQSRASPPPPAPPPRTRRAPQHGPNTEVGGDLPVSFQGGGEGSLDGAPNKVLRIGMVGGGNPFALPSGSGSAAAAAAEAAAAEGSTNPRVNMSSRLEVDMNADEKPGFEEGCCTVCHSKEDEDSLVLCECCGSFCHWNCMDTVLDEDELQGLPYVCPECCPASGKLREEVDPVLSDANTWQNRGDIWLDQEALAVIRGEGTSGSRRGRRRAQAYIWEDGKLFTAKGKREVPPLADRQSILQDLHTTLAHRGARAMVDLLRLSYYWYKMEETARQVVEQCEACDPGRFKPFNDPHLQSQPPSNLFEKWFVDLVGPFPPAVDTGNTYMMTGMCSYGRTPVAGGIKNKQAASVAKVFMDKVVWTYGVPVELVMDRGGEFRKGFLAMTRSLGIKVTRGSAYHPETQGLCERWNQSLEKGIMALLAEKNLPASHWERFVPQVVFAALVSKQATTKHPPFFLMYGQHARVPKSIKDVPLITMPAPLATEQQVKAQAERLEQAHQEVMVNIPAAQQRQARDFAKRRKTALGGQVRIPQVGELVRVTIPPPKGKGAKRSGAPSMSPLVKVLSYNQVTKHAKLEGLQKDGTKVEWEMPVHRLLTRDGGTYNSGAAVLKEGEGALGTADAAPKSDVAEKKARTPASAGAFAPAPAVVDHPVPNVGPARQANDRTPSKRKVILSDSSGSGEEEGRGDL